MDLQPLFLVLRHGRNLSIGNDTYIPYMLSPTHFPAPTPYLLLSYQVYKQWTLQSFSKLKIKSTLTNLTSNEDEFILVTSKKNALSTYLHSYIQCYLPNSWCQLNFASDVPPTHPPTFPSSVHFHNLEKNVYWWIHTAEKQDTTFVASGQSSYTSSWLILENICIYQSLFLLLLKFKYLSHIQDTGCHPFLWGNHGPLMRGSISYSWSNRCAIGVPQRRCTWYLQVLEKQKKL